MTPERWQRLKSLYENATDLPAAEREEYLASMTGTQTASDLRRLLEEEDRGDGFLEKPAFVPRSSEPGPAVPEGSADAASGDACTSANARGGGEILRAFQHGDRDDDSTGALRGFSAGEIVDERFRIIRFIAHGGMGDVYEAEDTAQSLKPRVALKTVRPEIAANPSFLQQFEREIAIGKTITHQNVCRIYDMGIHRDRTDDNAGDTLFLTMELLLGQTLSERLRGRGPMTAEEALPILRQLGEGLHAAHCARIVHRDFKPSNVMLTPSRAFPEVRAVITDLGLAQDISEPGDLLPAGHVRGGTPDFMSPEQVRGERLGPASDIYALGVVAYQMVTGKLPFNGDSANTRMVQRLHEDPVAPRKRCPSLDAKWEAAILRCLDREPTGRFESAVDFAHALEGGEVKPPPCIPPARNRAKVLIGSLAVVVLAAAGLWTGLALYPPKQLAPTIAVFPFDTGRPDPELQYLGDGIAGELIDSLTRQPGLRVIARGSSFNFRGPERDLRKASEALGVRYVVTGSARRLGGNVRIGVELIDPRTGFQKWAAAFDQPEKDIFKVHELIASEIASALGADRAGPPEIPRLHAINPEAHDLYLQALFHLNQRTREETLTAFDLLQKAISKAPDDAVLYTSLADCYSVMGDYRFKPPVEIIQPAEDAIRKALRLDSRLAEAHASFGLWATLYGWDMRLAEAYFKQSIALNPRYATAHQWYSQLLFKTGRFEGARVEARRALELDPISAAVNMNYGNLFYYSRDYPGLLRQSIREEAINPALPFGAEHKALALAYLNRGEQAVAAIERVKPMEGSDPLPIRIWAEVQALRGDRAKARAGLDRLIGLYLAGKAPASYPAMIYAGLGEKEKACDFLEKALEERDTLLLVMDVAPPYDHLRSHPRFLAVRAKVFKETTATY